MGKKYDKWVDASNAKREAEMDLAGAQGGSTPSHGERVTDNAYRMRDREEKTYREWREDPEG